MQELENELRKLLKQKKSVSYYAKKLGVSETQVASLKKKIKSELVEEESEVEIKYNLDKEEIKVSGLFSSPISSDEIIKLHKIDTTQYKLSSYWSIQRGKGWRVSAMFTKLPQETLFSNNFETFLQSYKSPHEVINTPYKDSFLSNGCLILNMQDPHYDKYDEDGDNNIEERFQQILHKAANIIARASDLHNLKKIIYVIGSDHFNAEWTEMTTKGTPQKNMLSYNEAFKLVCDHEVKMINLLLAFAEEVEVVLIGGNHDQHVSWHMVNWLNAYYKSQENLSIDGSSSFTKYIKWSNTALCFNHGDVQKPERLAQNFPIEFKHEWSNCDHYYILTGDRHCELSKSIGGIKFYQIPALSKAKSSWDKKNGYTTTKAEMTAFLLEEGEGMSTILKKNI